MDGQKQGGISVLPQKTFKSNTKARKLSSSTTIMDYLKEFGFHHRYSSSLKPLCSLTELGEQGDKIISEFRNKDRLSVDSDNSFDDSAKYQYEGHIPTLPPLIELSEIEVSDNTKQKLNIKSEVNSSSSEARSIPSHYYKREIPDMKSDNIAASMNVLYSERELLERNEMLKKINSVIEGDTTNTPTKYVHQESKASLPPVQKLLPKVPSFPIRPDRIKSERMKFPSVRAQTSTINSSDPEFPSVRGKASRVRPVSTMSSLAVLFSERELNEIAEKMRLKSKLSHPMSVKSSVVEFSEKDSAVASLAVLFSKRELEEIAEKLRHRSELQHLGSTQSLQPDSTRASLAVNFSEKELIETAEKLKMRASFLKRDSLKFGKPAVNESTPDIFSEKELSEIAEKMRNKRKLSPPVLIKTKSDELLAPNLTDASLAVLYSESELAGLTERMKIASEKGTIGMESTTGLVSDKDNEYKKYQSSLSPSVVVMYSEKELEDTRKRFRATSSATKSELFPFGTVSSLTSPKASKQSKEATLKQPEEGNVNEESGEVEEVEEEEQDIDWDKLTPYSLSSGASGCSGWETIGCSPEVWDSFQRPGNGLLAYSRFVLKDEECNGLLTDRIIASGQSCLDRIPGTRGYVYTKLELQGKMLNDISLLKYHGYLQYIDLSWNQLSDVSALGCIKHLKCLDLSHNELNKLLQFKAPWFLTHVNYSYNFVEIIEDLSEFWSLKVLDLSHNNVKKIEGFQNLKYLQILNLSFNEIKTIENLNSLRLGVLYLESNVIDDYKHDLSSLVDLKYLNLSDNLLTSLGLLANVSSLRCLDMRNNRIADLAELENMRNLTSLEVLNLSENDILSWPRYREVVIALLPDLVLLDNIHVSVEEKISAKSRFFPDVETHASWCHARILLYEKYSNPLIDLDVMPVDQPDNPLVVLVGPPASGKSDLLRRIKCEFKDKVYIGLPHTTRDPPKNTELEELQYYLTLQQFNDMYSGGEFLATSARLGYNYGFSRSELAKAVKMGCLCITDMWLTEALTLFATGIQPCLILTLIEDESMYLLKLANDYQYNKLFSVLRPQDMSKLYLKRPESYKISKKIMKDIIDQALKLSLKCVDGSVSREASQITKESKSDSDNSQELYLSKETSGMNGSDLESARDISEDSGHKGILNNISKRNVSNSSSNLKKEIIGDIQLESNSQINNENVITEETNSQINNENVITEETNSQINNENVITEETNSQINNEKTNSQINNENVITEETNSQINNENVITESTSHRSDTVNLENSNIKKSASKPSITFEKKSNLDNVIVSKIENGLSETISCASEARSGINEITEHPGKRNSSNMSYLLSPDISITSNRKPRKLGGSSEGSAQKPLRSSRGSSIILKEPSKTSQNPSERNSLCVGKTKPNEISVLSEKDSTISDESTSKLRTSTGKLKDVARSKSVQEDSSRTSAENTKGVAFSLQEYFESKISCTSNHSLSSESQLVEEFYLAEEDYEEQRSFSQHVQSFGTFSRSSSRESASQVLSGKSGSDYITREEIIDKVVATVSQQYRQECLRVHHDNPGLFEIAIYTDDLDEASCKLKKFLTQFIVKGKKHPNYYPNNDPAYKTFVLAKTNKLIDDINRSKSIMAQQQYEIQHPKIF